MEQMNSLYNITKQILVTLNQQCSTIDERTTMIDKVNELLEQRGKILETLTPPYSKKETTTGVKIINMDNMIKERIDRKSTRLNSSHVSISYAVFCLKQKK